MPSPTMLIGFSNIDLPKAVNNVYVHTTLTLIVNCGYFITIDDKVLGLLNNNFGGLNDNAMHCFCHLAIHEVTPTLARCVFHLQEI
jgi:hypothetical protein